MRVARFLVLAALLGGCAIPLVPSSPASVSGQVSTLEDVRFSFSVPGGWISDILPDAAQGETVSVAIKKPTPAGAATLVVSRLGAPEPFEEIEKRVRAIPDLEVVSVARETVAGAPALRLVEAYFVNGIRRQQVELYMDYGGVNTLITLSLPTFTDGDPLVSSDLAQVLTTWAWKGSAPVEAATPSPAASASPAVKTPQQIAKESFASTVVIYTKDAAGEDLGLGSGFVVRGGDTTLIATNFHVIQGASSATIKFLDQNLLYHVKGVVAVDKTHDLAILDVQYAEGTPIPMADFQAVAVGDKAYALGSPKGLEGTFSEGIVSSVRTEGSEKLLQITAPISPGNSGGPVLNDKGEVMGVATFYVKDSQNLNFAIPIPYVKAALDVAGELKAIHEVSGAQEQASQGATQSFYHSDFAFEHSDTWLPGAVPPASDDDRPEAYLSGVRNGVRFNFGVYSRTPSTDLSTQMGFAIKAAGKDLISSTTGDLGGENAYQIVQYSFFDGTPFIAVFVVAHHDGREYSSLLLLPAEIDAVTRTAIGEEHMRLLESWKWRT